jgi:potassium channel subfamily K
MILFCYICIGALINSLLLKLTFIDGLYFTLVSIETIGFGDIVPETTASKLFICAYSAIGFLNLGVAIVMCRETVLEAMEVEYRKRVHKVKERWKEVRTRGRVESRWRHAIEWRLKDIGMPLWVPDENWHGHRTGGGGRSVKRVQDQSDSVGFSGPKTGRSHSMLGPTGMRLNLKRLTLAQLEASALEAGVPLNTLLPSDFIPAAQETAVHSVSAASAWIHHPLASHFENTFHPTQARTLTHARLGGMSALLTRFAVAAIHIHAATPDEPIDDSLATQNPNPAGETVISAETTNNMNIDSPQTAEASKSLSHLDSHVTSAHSSDSLAIQMLHDLETMTFYAKLIIALSLFFLFWTVSKRLIPCQH